MDEQFPAGTKLLICGSRKATAEMLYMARKGVRRAIAREWSIIVGDAEGIDQCVMEECCRQEYLFTCYGTRDTPRFLERRTQLQSEFMQYAHYIKVDGAYFGRDRAMVIACDCVLAIWDGKSIGTQYTFNYAVTKRKKTWIIRNENIKESEHEPT